MGIETLAALAALMLAISLASERVVAIVKSLFPWLATEKKDAITGVVLESDHWRQLVVLGIAFLSGWITSALVAGKLPGAMVGNLNVAGLQLPTFATGLMATAGSAFWSSMVGWARAAKDARTDAAKEARARRVAAESSLIGAQALEDIFTQLKETAKDVADAKRLSEEAGRHAADVMRAVARLEASLKVHA